MAQGQLIALFGSKGSGNSSGYSNSALDAMLEKQSQTLDAKARQQLVYQIQETLIDDLPARYTYHPYTFLFTQGVKNWRFSVIAGNERRWGARYSSTAAT